MTGDPPDIFLGIRRGHRFATVGAIQTIRTLPYGFIRFEDKGMKPVDPMFFQPTQETPHPSFVTLYNLFETT
jgi:hypothetical protein